MTRSATSSLRRVRIATGSAGECRHPAERARPPRRPRRVHGRREDDIRPRYRGQARPGLPRSRPRDRGTGREDDSRSCSPSAARPSSGGSRSTPRASRSQRPEPLVISLGGGAVTSEGTRSLLRSAFVVLIEIDVDSAWERVRRSKRPLAKDEAAFRTLYAEREHLYRDVADAVVVGRRRDRAGRSRRALRARRPRPAR